MRTFITIFIGLMGFIVNSQETIPELLDQYNTKNIPYITPQELAMPKTKVLILDAREEVEYKTSHLKSAIFVGFNKFVLDSVNKKVPDKNEKIVVYCSVGIRSETIAKKLKKAGYKNIFNLYGGIFNWKNNGFPVYDSNEKETENIHGFSKEWSKMLKKGKKVL